jgi:hypothetical protein
MTGEGRQARRVFFAKSGFNYKFFSVNDLRNIEPLKERTVSPAARIEAN